MKTLFIKNIKCGWCISETKGYHSEIIVTIMNLERGFMNVFFIDAHLVVS